jgi:hypothetical protein
MELPSLLESMAEVSVTLAGFAAVFRAFGSNADPDGHSTVRLYVVIEGGIAVAVFCYLPAALVAAGLSPATAWRASNFAAIAWVIPRSIGQVVVIVAQGWPLPALLPLAFFFGVLGLVALGCGAFGVIPPPSGLQAGLVAVFAAIGCTFIAQFRVEHANK